jgi:hypothetical protein
VRHIEGYLITPGSTARLSIERLEQRLLREGTP